jgi:hypothetical protein
MPKATIGLFKAGTYEANFMRAKAHRLIGSGAYLSQLRRIGSTIGSTTPMRATFPMRLTAGMAI